jgi:hypothetical protein
MVDRSLIGKETPPREATASAEGEGKIVSEAMVICA